MDMSEIQKAVAAELNAWQEQTGCDSVTRMRMQTAVFFKHYHNALAAELKKSGISIELASCHLPKEDLK